MNRIIKFRVWDKKTNQWVETYSSTHNSCVNINEIFSQKEFIFQQFTGLKDDKNKDIYEGDILRVESYDGWFDKEPNYYNLLVEYRISPSGESDLSGFLYIPKFREVIGNIYENPELLRSAK